MRRPFVAGNWKMNLNRSDAVALATALAERTREIDNVELAVFPPAFTSMRWALRWRLARGLGAQNVYFEPDGAFTGEISTAMLKDLGAGT